MPELPPPTDEQDRAFQDAIASYVGAAIVTDYVIVATFLNEHGEPNLCDITRPGSAIWDQIGLLRAVLAAYEQNFADIYNHDEL